MAVNAGAAACAAKIWQRERLKQQQNPQQNEQQKQADDRTAVIGSQCVLWMIITVLAVSAMLFSMSSLLIVVVIVFALAVAHCFLTRKPATPEQPHDEEAPEDPNADRPASISRDIEQQDQNNTPNTSASKAAGSADSGYGSSLTAIPETLTVDGLGTVRHPQVTVHQPQDPAPAKC